MAPDNINEDFQNKLIDLCNKLNIIYNTQSWQNQGLVYKKKKFQKIMQ